ncbi:MAG: hypothetical protein DVB23_002299 [Verrucomicrobia bacterium]|nr:MAG: hypothetical protein DVB23_002299 [Verrucomicrobiota bacterium]
MKKLVWFTCFAVHGMAFAALDIVPVNKEGESLVYAVKTSSGKVLGIFWDQENGTSDYGFESSVVPDFLWSPDRSYVAVTAGASRSRTVTVYKAGENSLKEVSIPHELTGEKAAPLNEITDPVADGMDAVRWQPDGTLLVRFWSAQRLKDDNENQKEANVWADLDVSGAEGKIVGAGSVEPTPEPDGEESFDPERLVGTHQVSGRNPDGTNYSGKVEIRVKNGLVLLEWKIGKEVSHGTGLVVGMTLGVALDDGIAVYQIFGQSEGQSLIGFWSLGKSSVTNKEAIRIGSADMEDARVEVEKINGNYVSLREVGDGQVEGNVTISGGEIAKKVAWEVNGRKTMCQGMALGEGLAVITPAGLSVFSKRGDSLEGQSLTGKENISQESLIPAN